MLKSGLCVPCGKCPACLANQRAEWIFRLKQEAKYSEFSCFVTLTYDEEHVPRDMSVNKKDVQDFHKRLRKHFLPGDMRFYLVSEYGDHTFRPHYHGLYFFKHRYDINSIYDIFVKSWKLGFIKFGEVEEGSIVYCTKYCLKYKIIPEGRKPTFRLCSKMDIGGIGVQYLNKMTDYHVQNLNFISVYDEGKRTRMPRYYRSKIDPFIGGSKYNPLHDRKFESIRQDCSDALFKAFKEFLKDHKFASFEEAQEAFNKLQIERGQRRDDLLQKHVKKQKF